jgi:hypothetical protein
MSGPNFIANGTIQPSTFVVIDTTQAGNAVIAASGNSTPIIGIAQEWSKLAPTPGQSSEAADQGDEITVYSESDVCLLNATSAGWTAGDLLTSNASGFGVTGTSGQQSGAQALTTMAGVGLGRVKVINRKV